MVRVEMMQTDMIKGLKMLVNEARGSLVGAENKKVQPICCRRVRKLLYVNGMGFPTYWLEHFCQKKSLALSPSDKSKNISQWFIFIQFIQLATLIIYLQTSACTE